MSRRLAADKRPNGQTLQSLESFAHMRDSQEQGSFRGKPRGSRYTKDEDSPLPGGPPIPMRPRQPNARLPPRPQKTDIGKTVQKNVFIDSYYPVVLGDHTETSGGTHSSTSEEIHEEDVSADEKTDSSWETDSFEDHKNTPDADEGGHPSSNAQDLSQRSGTTLITVCPTLDSGTYTVLSCSSDIDSTFVNISQPPNDKASAITAPDDDHLPSPTAGCFNQLYHRIHNLEDLLQQAIVPPVQPKGSKHTKTVGGEWEKPKPTRKKLLGMKNPSGGMGKTWESNCLSIPELTDEKTSSDTDNELRNIKKRLRVLERKLRRSQQPPPASFALNRNLGESLTSSSLAFTENEGRSRDNDSTPSVRSETASFLQSEGFLNSGPDGSREADPRDKKAKAKVRKKIISKCRGIRKKCCDLVTPSKKVPLKSSPLKVSTTSGWSEVVYQHSVLTEESVATAFLNQSFSTLTKTDSSAVVYLRCQQEDHVEPPRKRNRKKNKKKRKYLCQKSSKTNIPPFPRKDAPPKEILPRSTPTTNTFVFGDCNLSSATTLHVCDSDNNPGHTLFDKSLWNGNLGGDAPIWEPHPFWIPFHHKQRPSNCYQEPRECTLKPAKPPNLISLDDLKRGGKLKIPVLFEEVCKTPDSKKLGHKLSNISMRFVVVQEDSAHPLTPLRKLINRLSQPKPPPRGEHFVFGVSKCGCDNQVHRLGSISHRNVASGFT